MILLSGLNSDPKPVPPGMRMLVRAGESLRNTGDTSVAVKFVQHGLPTGDAKLSPGQEHVVSEDCSVIVAV